MNTNRNRITERIRQEVVDRLVVDYYMHGRMINLSSDPTYYEKLRFRKYQGRRPNWQGPKDDRLWRFCLTVWLNDRRVERQAREITAREQKLAESWVRSFFYNQPLQPSLKQ